MLTNVLKSASKLLLITSVVAVASYAMAGRVGLATGDDSSQLVGSQASEFTLKNLSGVERKLSEFKGKYVLLDFWGTWCRPCIEALPKIRKTYAKVDKSKFEVIGICVDCDDLENFAETNELAWTQLIGDDVVTGAYGVNAFPTMFLVGPDGKVIGDGDSIPTLRSNLLETVQAYISEDQEKIAALTNAKSDQAAEPVESIIGKSLPNIELLTQYGEKESLNKYKGKTVLLNFWGTGRPNYMANMPIMRDVYHQLDHKKIAFVGVCFDCDDVKLVARDNDLDWVQLVVLKDEMDKMIKKFKLSNFPSTYLVDANGNVVATEQTMPELNNKNKILSALKDYLDNPQKQAEK